MMILGSSISVSTAETGTGVYSFRSTHENSAAKLGCLPGSGYIRLYGHLQCPNQFFFSAVHKLQIGSIFCSLVIFSPLVDCVYDLLWHGLFSPLVPFEYAPSFQIE